MRHADCSFRLGHRPSLDGIRGVAISLVLLNHGGIIPGGFAFFSVNTFFVLSGFLITFLLVKEWEKHQDISLNFFFLRRVLRLFPALIAMLFFFVLFVFLTNPYKQAFGESYQLLPALFYFSNWAIIFQNGMLYPMFHTWSLSVEEQFYIIWPLILLLLLRKTTRQSMLCWIFLGAFFSILLRSVFSICANWNNFRLLLGTDTRADSLLLGCFAGVLIASNLLPQQKWFLIAIKSGAYMSGVGILVLCTFPEQSRTMIYYGWFIASVFAMIIIVYLVSAVHHGFMHRFLGNKFLVYIGQISYGLYIWHFPILTLLQQYHLPWQNMAYLAFVVPVVLVSYHWIEKPCLNLKKSFQITDSIVVAQPKASAT